MYILQHIFSTWEENIFVNIHAGPPPTPHPPSDVLAAQKGPTDVKNLLDLRDATKPQ